MKILFTGASSFTGYWFVKKLVENGHEVFTVFTKNQNQYEGIRKSRVDEIVKISNPLFNMVFGSKEFIQTLNKHNFNVYCHHLADVTNYKSNEFDYLKALEKNTNNLELVFSSLKKNGCNSILLTGSIFENDEGIGNNDLLAFSKYGLSKGLTFQVFRFLAEQYGLKLGKFVIPNPFGPFEEPRFTNYLMKNWLAGNVPSVNTPKYIRDNIPVDLLADVYLYFLNNLAESFETFMKINPSGFVESQGDFTNRFAVNISQRLNINCDFKLNNQTEFNEPLIRVNSDNSFNLIKDWSEELFWDNLTDYYKSFYEKINQ